MLGVALKMPFADGPPDAQRLSRRMRGENPSILDGVPKTAAMKKLMIGGMGGRCRGDDLSWQLPTAVPGQKEVLSEQSTAEAKVGEQREGIFRLVDLTKLGNAINSMSCSCSRNDDMDSFSQFLCENNPTLNREKIEKLKEAWQQSRRCK